MELTESTFSGTSDRVTKDEGVQQQKVENALQHSEETRQDKSLEQRNAVISHLEQTKNGARGPSDEANDGDTPRRLPAIKAENASGHGFKPPVTPRKNLIPSRRTSFDNTVGPTLPKKGAADAPNNAQITSLDIHPTTNEGSAASTNHAQNQQDAHTPSEQLLSEANASQSMSKADISNQPARIKQPNVLTPDASSDNGAIGPSTDHNQPFARKNTSQADENSVAHIDQPASNEYGSDQPVDRLTMNQEAGFTTSGSLSTEYHDTSAAEAAWDTVDQNDELSKLDTHILASATQIQARPKQQQERPSAEEIEWRATTAAIETRKMAAPVTPLPPVAKMSARSEIVTDIPTTPLPAFVPIRPLAPQKKVLTRSKALLLLLLSAILLLNASAVGFNQFFGPQGWGSVWNNSGQTGPNLLTQISQQLQHSPTPGSKGTPTPPTPTQIVNLLMSNMTLDEKLGQMMMIQFTGQSYSTDLDTMISQYHVGSVLYFQFNIGSKTQLTGLNAEMQHNANLPLLVSVDQEGGTVDRLVNLDGPQPSASQIGASNNPNLAYQQGLKDARDLASYGFNLNLAPVVDVNNVYNPQLYDRTYGNNPTIVSQMAEKYLEGLQHSGKVLGTLKHFPGLGDVSTDPHYGLPALTRDLNSLNSIDWAPYSTLIKQGHVYSIMVTHEIVDALDKTEPSSLSPQVIGILRNQMHFQGVIITDSLTMDSIHNFYTYGDAAAKAVEAGDDILMGADSPSTLAQMLTGIKQAMSSGAITQQHIDDSVRRILLFKYEMGLLHV